MKKGFSGLSQASPRISNLLAYILAPLLVLGSVFLLSRSLPLGLMFTVGIAGMGVLLVCIANPKLAFYINTTYIFFIYLIQRLIKVDFPVSMGTEAITLTLLVGVFVKKIIRNERIWYHINNPITYMALIQILYTGLEAFNPNVDSLVGWTGVFRKTVEIFIYYLISLYILDSKKEIKFFIKFWIALTFIASLYATYEQHFGLTPWDHFYATSDPHRFGLLFQNGFIRKFSTLSDPAAFGILAASTAILAICLAMGKFSFKKKVLLVISAIVMLMGMSYSGTRTANVLIPLGIILYVMLTIRSKKTIIFLGASILIGMFLVFAPIHSNPVLNRMRSSFHPKDDPSMKLRDEDRKSVQPYMHSHPIGGGLGTTGFAGLVNYPHHPLANFQPDGGFVQNALEIGWIGLILELVFYFIVLKQGIHYFYRCKDPEIKNIYAALTATLFCWIVAEFSQGATGTFNITYIYIPVLAILVKLRYFDSPPEKPISRPV